MVKLPQSQLFSTDARSGAKNDLRLGNAREDRADDDGGSEYIGCP